MSRSYSQLVFYRFIDNQITASSRSESSRKRSAS